MTWTKFFDAIYLINLARRTERFMTAAEELEQYGIPFQRIDARDYSGYEGYFPQTGVTLTVREIFDHATSKNYSRILVFEDDLQFVENPNNYMPAVIRQLDGLAWDMLSLGPNTHETLEKVSDNLLRMKGCRALHAMAYSYDFMRDVMKGMKINPEEHLDQVFERDIQPKGNSYCTYPLLCTQRNGPSDISGETDKSYIEKRFRANTLHLEV